MFEYVGPPLTRQRLGAVLEANGVSDRGMTFADLAERDYRTSDALYAGGEPSSRS